MEQEQSCLGQEYSKCSCRQYPTLGMRRNFHRLNIQALEYQMSSKTNAWKQAEPMDGGSMAS